MLETTGNLWEIEGDTHVVTTNGILKSNGELVMGKGIALQAKRLYPDIAKDLGYLVGKYGNHSYVLQEDTGIICSFPTKHHWRDASDPKLIVQSAKEMVIHANEFHLTRIIMPQPGCGLGQLNWADVRSLLYPILDNRFCVVSY